MKLNILSLTLKCLSTLLFIYFLTARVEAQDKISPSRLEEITSKIAEFKLDERGPYKDIRWFCPDGTIIAPREKCSQPGGIQRARYKDWVDQLAERNRIYLGQILAGTDKEAFYDKARLHSRMKQYLLEQFLYNADDGWIQRKSRYYRGAMQDEDESAWGREFLLWIFESGEFSEDNYFLVRELFKYLPHRDESNLIQTIRAVSKTLSEERNDFMPIRIKIHGNPSPSDVETTKAYLARMSDKLSSAQKLKLNQLIDDMIRLHSKSYKDIIGPRLSVFKAGSPLRGELESFVGIADKLEAGEELIVRTIDLLALVKSRVLDKNSASARMALMDISVELEEKTLPILNSWAADRINTLLEKLCYLSQFSAATGHIYDWEHDQLQSVYSYRPENRISLAYLYDYFKGVRRNINWGAGMITAEFEDEIALFSRFEPLSSGFVDDRIRSSVLLNMGELAASLNAFIVEKAGNQNRVFGKASSSIYGVNPGYARGKLIVTDEIDEHNVDPSAIYAFRKPPSDLEPVSGILSISEGNVVSHIQLLARNLGIPNANISDELFASFKKYHQQEIFYAVSQKGGVVIKPAGDMTAEEKTLFRTVSVDESIIEVPVDKMQLDVNRVLALSEVDAASSGILCGPKAANFARLKRLFPDRLVNGLVVPFGVFKDHMLQTIPEKDISYWDFLKQTFQEAERMEDDGRESAEINTYCLARLSELSELILDMKLKPGFTAQLKTGFASELGTDMGALPVFLRSDTNMEDLKDFTGAGLNLTLFNLVDEAAILQGIKKVWASPYSERSYKWRQKFLTNPEDVYPSILIIPSVFVDKSGVVITKDFIESNPGSLNVAFSLGVGGAVDGQKAESWILNPDGSNILVSPSRDREYKYLSGKGSTLTKQTKLDKRILEYENIRDIWRIYQTISVEMPKAGMASPYDIELGYENDKLWLFQIRPFVENKKAGSSMYLAGLDPVISEKKNIKPDEKI